MTTATRKIVQIAQSEDQKKAIMDAVGDISGVDVLFNQVLIGVYVRPEKTKGGIILTNNTLKEDEYQGKVGLVLKVGPTAFKNSGDLDFAGQDVEVGDWVVFRTGDGWPFNLNGAACRLLSDRTIRLRVGKPEDIY